MKLKYLYPIMLSILAAPAVVTAVTIKASISTGLGYDSNAYHSPGSPYTDYSLAVPAIVTPKEQSGFFIPLAIDASLNQDLSQSWMLKGVYSFDGSKYIDSKLENADAYDHILHLGVQDTLTNTNLRSSHIYAGLRMQDHQQTYADRDTGGEKTTSSITNPKNISDLYSYTATGMELGYDYKQKQSWDVDVSYRQENRDFATPPPVSSPEQDHTYTKLGATFGYEMGTNWRAEFDVAKAKRDYDFRHAHDLDGGYSTVVLTYDFTDFGITIKQDVNQKLKMSYGYATIARTDNNVGYNDYDLSEFTLGARYDFTNWLSLKGKLVAWQQDYPNAWNFDCDPTAGGSTCPANTGYKTVDGTTLNVRANIARSKDQDWWLDMELVTNNNTDDRYNYDRNVLMAGATWKF